MKYQIWKYINLREGEDVKTKVLENVTSNISFRGANLWILACAIIIASVGLNVNSTAVVIGAMLISPLMGPIVGAGFALGTYNFELFKRSMKNLLIATAVSLVVSAIYFYLSPFKDVESEILARTAPTIYDVIIAFFGGLVGIIAITRVEKGNPIPGVAIATALMPPLCTAGYGLATFNLSYFAGAFYLYTINCFFICIATFLIVKYLKYPPHTFINPSYEKKIRTIIYALIFVMIVPSSYLAYNLFNERTYAKAIQSFIDEEFINRDYDVFYKKINYNESPKTIELAFINKKFTEQEIEMYNKILVDRGVEDTKLIIKQDGDIKAEILKELGKHDADISEKDVTINNLRQELDKYKVNEPNIVEEIKILYPQVTDVMLGTAEKYAGTDSLQINHLVLYSVKNDSIDPQKLERWLVQRFQTKNLILMRTPKTIIKEAKAKDKKENVSAAPQNQ